MRFVSILREAGLPEAWCQACVTEDHEVAQALVTDNRVDFFSFIGSANVGWMLRSRLAPGTRCALEHGGSAPVVVAADADLDDMIPALAKAGFYHAGQVCVSVQRVFALQTMAEQIATAIAVLGNKMTVGDPTLDSTDIGPLIRPEEVERVHSWVEDARKKGAKILSGGSPVSETCYPPTVILDAPANAIVSNREVFGPVICIYGCEDIDDAIRQANSLPFSFQSAVYTRNLDTAMKAYRQLNASAVMVNDHTAFRVDWMPFAGLKISGHGTGGIPYTYEDMTVDKMMVIRSGEL